MASTRQIKEAMNSLDRNERKYLNDLAERSACIEGPPISQRKYAEMEPDLTVSEYCNECAHKHGGWAKPGPPCVSRGVCDRAGPEDAKETDNGR